MSPLTDETIDRVAQQFTDADPSPRLRARVLASLDRSPAPRRLWWMPAVATVAATIVVVALWPHPQAPALPALPPVAADRAPFALDMPPLTKDATSQSATRTVIVAGRRVNAATTSADRFEFHERAIPALDKPTPLAIESIQPQPLSIPLLVVSPLSTLPSGATTAGGDGGK